MTKAVRPRAATEIDEFIGSKIRGYRNQSGISQDELGKKLGVTFQQVQKYEKGVNRISGSRMQQLADIFNISIADLLPERNARKKMKLTNLDLVVATREGSKLVDSFVLIKSENLRGAVVDLAKRFEGL